MPRLVLGTALGVERAVEAGRCLGTRGQPTGLDGDPTFDADAIALLFEPAQRGCDLAQRSDVSVAEGG